MATQQLNLPELTTLLLTNPSDYVLLVTLNRPAVRNAINAKMMQELNTLWQSLLTENHQIRCVVITGAGEHAFCAGADLKERKELDLTTWQQQHLPLEEAMLAMHDCPVPVIAAVNGAAYGGGLELALNSDFIYAAPEARFC